MLRLLPDLGQGIAIEQLLDGRCAYDPVSGAYLRRSNGRRRSGRAAKYYLKLPCHELGEAIGITAYSDEEAVEKANGKLVAAGGWGCDDEYPPTRSRQRMIARPGSLPGVGKLAPTDTFINLLADSVHEAGRSQQMGVGSKRGEPMKNQIVSDEINEMQESLEFLRRRNNVLVRDLETLRRKLAAAQGLVDLVDNLTSGNIFDEEGVCTYCGAPTGYGDATHYTDCVYLELRTAVSYCKEVSRD